MRTFLSLLLSFVTHYILHYMSHYMSFPSKESVDFEDKLKDNGTGLLPILPTVIRDARYQGDAR